VAANPDWQQNGTAHLDAETWNINIMINAKCFHFCLPRRPLMTQRIGHPFFSPLHGHVDLPQTPDRP
jgi:hypothetical protein